MFAAEDSHWWYVGLHELVLATVRRVAAGAPGPLRILDVGCGTGRLMQLMRRVATVEGFDIAPEAAACCRERGLAGVTVADLNDAALPAGSFDVITAIDVLSHRGIRDEIAVLAALRHALKPGGALIRNDPAFEGLRSAHDAAVHSRVRYRAQEVRRRLEAAGLLPEFVTYRLAALAPLIALHRLSRRREARQAPGEVVSDVRLPHPLVNRALLAAVRLENRGLRRCSLPFGTSVFAVARRPIP